MATAKDEITTFGLDGSKEEGSANVTKHFWLRKKMVLFDINLFHKGTFEYVDGHMHYVGGKKTVIMENNSDFWSVFEAHEQLKRFGYWGVNIAALWYKDPQANNLEVALMQFTNDADALDMVRIGELRGSVDLFVVHETGLDVEGFPAIGWIDVGGEGPVENAEAGEDGGGGNVNGNNGAVENDVDDGVAAENDVGNGVAAENDVDDGVAAENEVSDGGETEGGVGQDSSEHLESGEVDSDGAEEVHGEADGSVDDDTEEFDYVPSEKNSDNADDVQFTDSEEDFDLDDNGFGIGEGGLGSGGGNENVSGAADKGKGKLNEDFSNDEGSEELEDGHGFRNYAASEDDGDDSGRHLYPVHKPLENMANYEWRVGTIYTSRDKFKETVSAYAVYTQRGIKFDYCDKKRVIAICVDGCPFRLYCVKVQGVGIMHSKWVGKAFKKKVEVNPKVKIKELVAKADRKWNLIVTASMAARSKKTALDEIQGCFRE
ncbi:hypothetical protein PIB30_043225 [Stylosanthes scabra]|uniref:Transposase MuDR plant domain-containing protein n=1 Tax=Stylosanthes scabra TaxID=79078 RepID=A0ABU6QG22_9FABA|nr:hypothetical protein [Stylosanthes scabra]